MKLDVRAFALSCGVLWGATIFFATLWLLFTGHHGALMSRLGYFYIGYTFSMAGAFVGFLWGFVDAAIGGAVFAFLYNALSR